MAESGGEQRAIPTVVIAAEVAAEPVAAEVAAPEANGRAHELSEEVTRLAGSAERDLIRLSVLLAECHHGGYYLTLGAVKFEDWLEMCHVPRRSAYRHLSVGRWFLGLREDLAERAMAIGYGKALVLASIPESLVPSWGGSQAVTLIKAAEDASSASDLKKSIDAQRPANKRPAFERIYLRVPADEAAEFHELAALGCVVEAIDINKTGAPAGTAMVVLAALRHVSEEWRGVLTERENADA